MLRSLRDDAATRALGAELAPLLVPGVPVCLEGDLGAGKSTLARAMIQTLLASDEPVPSPTFTITQHYETPDLRIVHADLYRLSEVDELIEIGLDQDMRDALTLIEWPDRLGADMPVERLVITLETTADGGREARLEPHGDRAEAILNILQDSRTDAMAAFLDGTSARGEPLDMVAGDASNRRYFRAGEAILMDAPPERGEDVRPFVAVTQRLRRRGLSAPEVLARDDERGFLLLEDLGDDLYARLCAVNPSLEPPLYEAAVDLLHSLDADPADGVPPYDRSVLDREAALLIDWWCPAAGMGAGNDLRAEYLGLMREALGDIAETRNALVLRDYHAENLLWLPEREGDARVGLLDYQDALIGHPAYDLVSLLEDARRDLSPGLAEAMVARFLSRRPDLDDAAFRAAYDALGAQRNAKIVGIFARLCVRDGKPRYLSMIPRVWAHFRRDLSAPAMAPLRKFVEKHIPEPTESLLNAIAKKHTR